MWPSKRFGSFVSKSEIFEKNVSEIGPSKLSSKIPEESGSTSNPFEMEPSALLITPS
jgi:hypothetical protein